jgi:hypothetical protein
VSGQKRTFNPSYQSAPAWGVYPSARRLFFRFLPSVLLGLIREAPDEDVFWRFEEKVML